MYSIKLLHCHVMRKIHYNLTSFSGKFMIKPVKTYNPGIVLVVAQQISGIFCKYRKFHLINLFRKKSILSLFYYFSSLLQYDYLKPVRLFWLLQIVYARL